MEESERQSTIIWGADNTFKSFLVEKGDVDSVWKEAAHIVEGEYFTGAQEQLYIEIMESSRHSNRGGASPFGALSNVRITFTKRSWLFADFPKTKFAWCKWRREARSAGRKNIRR